eukprot:6740248-Lingulodinium_polyedra.AAC.1
MESIAGSISGVNYVLCRGYIVGSLVRSILESTGGCWSLQRGPVWRIQQIPLHGGPSLEPVVQAVH